jgi:hypothetical protein
MKSFPVGVNYATDFEFKVGMSLRITQKKCHIGETTGLE